MDILGIIVTLLVITASLLIMSKLGLGIEIDSPKKALIAAIVFGLLNAFIRPIISFLAFPITFLTFGLFSLVINAIIFGLAAMLVSGFRLKWGFMGALIGAFALSVINQIIFKLLEVVL